MPQLQEDDQGPDQAPHVHGQGHEEPNQNPEHHTMQEFAAAARVQQPFRRFLPAILDMNHPRARIHNLRDVPSQIPGGLSATSLAWRLHSGREDALRKSPEMWK